jgi:hypothetical protein
MANSSLCNPVVVTNDAIEVPQRIGFNEKEIDERWVQDVIQKQPNSLPASYFDVRYDKLISVGYEVELDDGYIDNLLVTPQGDLVIVETKLWRNPEARRQVIAQITDYAKSLMNWSFDEFNQAAKEYSNAFLQKELGIVDLVMISVPDVDGKIFHDNLERNLSQGKMLLLVVGDGIRENVEGLVEFFQNFTNIQFTLGLIELKVYQLTETQRLIVPDILFKTKEIQRAIVSIHESLRGKINVDVDHSLEVQSQKKKNKTISPEEYFRLLKQNVGDEAVVFAKKVMDEFSAKGLKVEWRTNSFIVRVFDTQTKKIQTLFGFYDDGDIWFPLWGDYTTKEQKDAYGKSWNSLYPELTFKDYWLFTRIANEELYKKFISIIDNYAKITLDGMRNKK